MFKALIPLIILSFSSCTPVSTPPPVRVPLKVIPDQSQGFPFGDDFLQELKFSGSIEVEIFKIVDPQFKQTQKIPSQLMILSQLLETKKKIKDIFYDCYKTTWIKKSDSELDIQRACEKKPQTIARLKKVKTNEYKISFIQAEWRSVIGDSVLLNQKDKVCSILISDHKVFELSCEDTLLTLGTGAALEEIRIKKYKFSRTDKNQIVLSGGRYKDYLERSKIDVTVPDEGKIKVEEIEMAVRDDFAKSQEKEGKKEMKVAKIPNITVLNQNEEKVSLKSLKGQKVILYFYPKDSTPGCTIEGIDFNNLLPKFKKLNAVVYGISRDSVKSHVKFCDKFKFKFDLLSDEDEKLCQHFDVIKEKNMYGKKVMGIERSTFVFDEDQNLVGEFRKVKAEGHAQFILDEVKKLD